MRRSVTIVGLSAVLSVVAYGSSIAGAAPGTSHIGGREAAAAPAPAAASPAASPAASTPAFTNWPTYHRTDSRHGHTAHALGTLHHAWTASLDGAVYGEPLVVGTTLVVATENDTVYGLNARTGKHRWRKHLATPESQSDLQGDLPNCGDIFPSGITGTPAYDASTGSVFAVTNSDGGHHRLWALKASTGSVRWHRSLDVLSHRDPRAEQERSALLVTHGRVITTFGGVSGDCGNYAGYATSVATSGHGTIHHYAVPTAREAGMWSPAGPATGTNGNVYVASGNGAEEHGTWDKSDSVTELTPTDLHRVSVFAPKTWKQDNVDDLDLGSSSPVSVDGREVIAGKRGTVYLLKPTMGGVGSAVTNIKGCAAYGGDAVVGRTVLLPCKGSTSIRALRVGKSHLRFSWTASDLYGSPVVAGRRVYVADQGSGDLVVLSLTTGKVLQRIHAGSMTHFPSEIVDGGHAFVPTTSGITAFTD